MQIFVGSVYLVLLLLVDYMYLWVPTSCPHESPHELIGWLEIKYFWRIDMNWIDKDCSEYVDRYEQGCFDSQDRS